MSHSLFLQIYFNLSYYIQGIEMFSIIIMCIDKRTWAWTFK